MKPNLSSLFTRVALVAGCASILCAPVAVHAELVLPRVSPAATVKQTVGTTDLSVTYSRPGVKGRTIWGELVPNDQPWRTGANEATTFTTTDDIMVGGQALAAGTYSFFTIPTAGAWSVIFSNQKELWGAYEYDSKQDALRLAATPTAAEATEWLQFTFEDLTPTSADLTLRWEKSKLTIPIAVNVNTIVMTAARAEVAAAKADDWRTPFRAAQFTFDNNVALEEGAKWLDQSIAIEAGYANLNLKARWQAKTGDTKAAVATAKKALEINKKAETPANTAAFETQVAEWSGKKKS
jgi:hypothetical protein